MKKIITTLLVCMLVSAQNPVPNPKPPQPLTFTNNPYCNYVITIPPAYPCETTYIDCMEACKNEYLYNIKKLINDSCKQFERTKDEYFKKLSEIQTKLSNAVSADPANYKYYKSLFDSDLDVLNFQYSFNLGMAHTSFETSVKIMKESYYSCTRLCCF